MEDRCGRRADVGVRAGAGAGDVEGLRAILVEEGAEEGGGALESEALRFAAVLREDRNSRDLDALLRRDLDADAARLFQPIDLGALARETLAARDVQLRLLGLA